MVTTFGQPSARSHRQGVFKGGYTPKTQQWRGFQQKGDSFWGSFRGVLGEGKTSVPAEALWTPRIQCWRGFAPDSEKS